MQISHDVDDNQTADTKRWTGFSPKWLAVPACLLMIFSAGFLVNAHQVRNTGGVTVIAQQSQPSVAGQAQDTEKIQTDMAKLATTPSIWPTSGEVTSGFGWRSSPWGDGSEMHPGIDIANSIGSPIFATADGVVVQSGWAGGYGNIVHIDHGNGIETIYGHNSRVSVSVGQSVKKGQIIAYSGNTGRSTGPHAHYEVRVNGTAVDPIRFLVL
ncbi:hypothetical protein SPACI_017690 [Sporomusa acidovorans DSM 3132]|uniref:M23ase beta-sheet core domain-containing protein n=1 Tax=Sporomusa acidovorans (strain ATCC 49682 / DSM 3132 / Mol) TaxID=1123286 RepID=A0ABZ3J0H5_SPOA4|nr:murein DD-endopeptidase MepM [Sporomusa acidovorans DSM 3132]SDE50874.1 Peptidase family M23 [Sporomusa acidovorans]